MDAGSSPGPSRRLSRGNVRPGSGRMVDFGWAHDGGYLEYWFNKPYSILGSLFFDKAGLFSVDQLPYVQSFPWVRQPPFKLKRPYASNHFIFVGVHPAQRRFTFVFPYRKYAYLRFYRKSSREFKLTYERHRVDMPSYLVRWTRVGRWCFFPRNNQ